MSVQLIDAKQRNIGKVRIASKVEELLTGEFVPSSDFALVEELFGKFEEAVDVQALSVVEQLNQQIAAFGLHLYIPEFAQLIAIHDIQIWRDGGFSCRLQVESTKSVIDSLIILAYITANQKDLRIALR